MALIPTPLRPQIGDLEATDLRTHLLAGDASSILVLRALGLGDFLTAVPALRALRRGYPDSRITLATPAALAPLLPLTGAVDDLRPTLGLGQLGRPDPVPDLVVNLHGSGPESVADAVGTGAAAILTHAHPDFPDLPGPAWRNDGHEVERWCRLVAAGGLAPVGPAAAGLAADRSDLRLARPDRDSPAPGAVVVHPGSTAAGRRWPAERFGAVAGRLAALGHRVVVTGVADEAGLARTVLEAGGLPASASLVGRLDLAELAVLVADAALVVSGDTGVAHLASAYRTPSVVVFGVSSPERWGPPADGPHRVLWRGPDGLAEITVEEVAEAARAQLGLPCAGIAG